MIKKKDLSQEDKQTWEDYIKDPLGIYDKDNKIQKNIRKERFKFDLHGFTLEEANTKVREVTTTCHSENSTTLNIIIQWIWNI